MKIQNIQAHFIYIGCACIYLTSMLLAKRRNRYERQI
jgi:hypothetical protein